MLHIILGILKILGILLLAVITVLLLILLVLLFVPLRYCLRANLQETWQVRADITFLFRFLHVQASFREKTLHWAVKLCGHTLLGNGAQKKAAKETKTDPVMDDTVDEDASMKTAEESVEENHGEQADETGSVMPVESDEPEHTKATGEAEYVERPKETAKTADETKKMGSAKTPEKRVDASPQKAADGMAAIHTARQAFPTESEDGQTVREDFEHVKDPGTADDIPETGRQDRNTESEEGTGQVAHRSSIFSRLKRQITSFFQQIKGIFAGIGSAFRRVQQTVAKIKAQIDRYRRFWNLQATQAAYRHIKKEAWYLLRHFRPRRLEGNLLFGTDDPALTGQILGGIYAAQGFLGSRLAVEADFERKVLEGNVYVKGHVRGCHLVKSVLALLIDKHIRITVKRFLKMIRE